MTGSGILAQVIEDDPAMVRFIRRTLELEDFQVVVSGYRHPQAGWHGSVPPS